MVYKYEWKYLERNVSAQIVGEHIQALEQRDSVVTPESFLDSARAEKSPIHPLFEWDDSVAAEHYRIQQSRKILTSIVKVVVPPEEGKTIEKDNQKRQVAFVNVTEGVAKRGEYITTEKALSQPETRQIVLNNALRELLAFKNKYESFSELAELFSVIDKCVVENMKDSEKSE